MLRYIESYLGNSAYSVLLYIVFKRSNEGYNKYLSKQTKNSYRFSFLFRKDKINARNVANDIIIGANAIEW